VPPFTKRLVLVYLASLVRYKTICLIANSKQRKQQQQQQKNNYEICARAKRQPEPIRTIDCKQVKNDADDLERQPLRNPAAILDGLDFIRLTKANHNNHHLQSNGNAVTSPRRDERDNCDGMETFTRLTTWRRSSAQTKPGSVRPTTDHLSLLQCVRPSNKSCSAGGKTCRKSTKLSAGVQTPSSKDNSAEWREVSRVLDRVFFWFICLMMTSSTLLILLYPKYASSGGSNQW